MQTETRLETYKNQKKVAENENRQQKCYLFLLLRRMGSNHRPSGYEPDELPLLYSAIERSARLKLSAKRGLLTKRDCKSTAFF